MKEKIQQAYDGIAKEFNATIDHKPHNAYYDRPNTLRLVGDCRGKRVLDAGCGPGKYAEELMTQGAEVTGFDLSPQMIACAKERNENRGTFFVHDMEEPLTMLQDNSFDVILSALAMHYIRDWNATLGEFQRLLVAGGRLVISIEHPFFEYTYFQSEQYFAVEPVRCTWNGFESPTEMNSYRRPLGACIAPLTRNGFCIDELLEPRPTKEFEKLDPKHFKELNEFPAFLCMSASKT